MSIHYQGHKSDFVHTGIGLKLVQQAMYRTPLLKWVFDGVLYALC